MSDVAELTARLVEIESINPDIVAGGSGEGWRRAVRRRVVRARGAWRRQSRSRRPGRPNVVAVARGSGGGRSLMLNAHMDTVGVAGMAEPFVARLEGGRLYGRGSYDMKGSLAACMLATAEAKRRGLRGDVILTAVCRRGVRERRHGGGRCDRPGRRGDRDRADGASARGRASRLRPSRGRGARPSRARLASGPRHRRDREDGPRTRRDRGARPAAARRPDAPCTRKRQRPRVADRGRAGVLELSGALRASGRAADDSR